MRANDLIYETWQALDANRGRSLLTVLGIVIGIGAVITMTALIGGVRNSLMGSLGLDSSRAIYLMAGGGLDDEAMDAVEKNVSGYDFLTGISYGSSTASTGTSSVGASVMGVESRYFTATGSKVSQGRAFTADEEKSGSQVVIMNSTDVQKVFGSDVTNPVGRSILLGSDEYLVVGVIQSSSMMGGGDSISVYLPQLTAQQRITGEGGTYSQVIGFAREGVDVDELVDSTKTYLASYYHLSEEDSDQIYVMSMKSSIDELNSLMSAFQLLMTVVASVSLVVGGIGIMNMMLTNVTERIREIGLRKALGAKRRDITTQFLLEAVTLCLIGGLIGIALGLLGSLALAAVASTALTGGSITPVISPESILFTVGVCVGIGILFGYYPARRAAALDPIESLRYQ